MTVVCDTSPLCYLILIDDVEILPQLFGRVIIPNAVCTEFLAEGSYSQIQNWIAQPPTWLEIQTATPLLPNLSNKLRQRNEHAKRLARNLTLANAKVVLEDLNISGLVRNHKLAYSISDASWYNFRQWLEYFGAKFKREIIAVPPHFTSQECSNCSVRVQKSLSTRTHSCPHCGHIEQRDVNAAKVILSRALGLAVRSWGDPKTALPLGVGNPKVTLAERLSLLVLVVRPVKAKSVSDARIPRIYPWGVSIRLFFVVMKPNS